VVHAGENETREALHLKVICRWRWVSRTGMMQESTYLRRNCVQGKSVLQHTRSETDHGWESDTVSLADCTHRCRASWHHAICTLVHATVNTDCAWVSDINLVCAQGLHEWPHLGKHEHSLFRHSYRSQVTHIDLDEKTIFHLQTWGVLPMVDLLETFWSQPGPQSASPAPHQKKIKIKNRHTGADSLEKHIPLLKHVGGSHRCFTRENFQNINICPFWETLYSPNQTHWWAISLYST
jgi:hypothetical protein